MNTRFVLSSLLALCGVLPTFASPTVKVEHFSVNNTLVRVEGDGKYLLLPVGEASSEASVNVLVDGNLERTIYVRLATSAVDYMVPFDLTPYKGHKVALNVVTNNGLHSESDRCWSDLEVVDEFDTTNREKFRPLFHHTPKYGWMNDPNGMFYKDGEWHLYYQWNPYGSKWQNMTWGHASSPDLVNWTEHDAVLTPNGLGAIFSGSCAIDHNNDAGFGKDAVIALYTSAAASQVQSLAHSLDNGYSFTVYPGNPVLSLSSEARDPNFFFDPVAKKWNLILAHPLDHEMLIFSSTDLKEWKYSSSFGRGEGAQNGVWECPDLFPLKVDDSDQEKWVMICSINPGGPFGGSATQYFVGDFDGKTFTPDRLADGSVPTKWMDFGKDHYATVSWSDAPSGRRSIIAWMSNWQYADIVPTLQYRSANSLPRDLSLFTAPDGQVYLKTNPSPEVENIVGRPSIKRSNVKISARPQSFQLPTANSGICAIDLTIDPKEASKVELTLSNAGGESVVVSYDVAAKLVSFDRNNSGIVDFSKDFCVVSQAPTLSDSNVLSLRLFIDRSSIEIFGNKGKFVLTNLVFPHSPYTTLSVSADRKCKVSSISVAPISPSSPN